MYWNDTPILSIDTETTGLKSHDRICEIALVVLEGDEPVDGFATLINPGIPISEGASEISGITDDMVKNEPTFEDVFDEILGYLKLGLPWVAHNMGFDMRMLSYDIPPKHWPRGIKTLCTKDAARSLLLYSRALNVVSEHFGIEQQDAHRAFDDAVVCGRVARCLTDGRSLDETYTKLSHHWI